MRLLLCRLVTGKDLFQFKNIGQCAAAQTRIALETNKGLSDLHVCAGGASAILTQILMQLLQKTQDRIFIQKARQAPWFVLVEDFMPTDLGMIKRFLNEPNYFEAVKWKHFNSEPWDNY
jgi:hypothetical protein